MLTLHKPSSMVRGVSFNMCTDMVPNWVLIAPKICVCVCEQVAVAFVGPFGACSCTRSALA